MGSNREDTSDYLKTDLRVFYGKVAAPRLAVRTDFSSSSEKAAVTIRTIELHDCST